LICCTISGNSADFGGGLYLPLGTATIGNCIIAGNSAGSANNGPDVSGYVTTSQGYNLIGVQDGSSGWTGPNDTIGIGLFALFGLLEPLADNGGPTETMALHEEIGFSEGTNFVQALNPAIAQGKSFGLTTDQRNLTRPVNFLHRTPPPGGDRSDIGAYEAQTTVCPIPPLSRVRPPELPVQLRFRC
jgi:hypothetical protein